MKKGVQKKVSKEDKFIMASLQPACHAPKFSNEYFLTVRTEFDGCICSQTPHARSQMTIVPLLDPSCFGYQAGHDFSELGAYNFDLTHEPDSH